MHVRARDSMSQPATFQSCETDAFISYTNSKLRKSKGTAKPISTQQTAMWQETKPQK